MKSTQAKERKESSNPTPFARRTKFINASFKLSLHPRCLSDQQSAACSSSLERLRQVMIIYQAAGEMLIKLIGILVTIYKPDS